jgi:hypothetical protein
MVLVVAFASACSKGTLVAEGEVPVFQHPYPVGSPAPNPVVAMLHAGDNADVRDADYTKDGEPFYEVKLQNGKRGFVIGAYPFWLKNRRR